MYSVVCAKSGDAAVQCVKSTHIGFFKMHTSTARDVVFECVVFECVRYSACCKIRHTCIHAAATPTTAIATTVSNTVAACTDTASITLRSNYYRFRCYQMQSANAGSAVAT
jgi:hypothetical protein